MKLSTNKFIDKELLEEESSSSNSSGVIDDPSTLSEKHQEIINDLTEVFHKAKGMDIQVLAVIADDVGEHKEVSTMAATESGSLLHNLFQKITELLEGGLS